MNARLIIELPTSLSASIITEWLSVKDRVRLDSAHCQSSVREEFLQLNRSPELSVKSWVQDQTHSIHQALVTWALMRKVMVEKLSVGSEDHLDFYHVYLQKFGSRVIALRLNCSKIANLAHSIATCRNLLVLKVHNWKLSASLRDVFVCCKMLRMFSSFGFYFPDPDPDANPDADPDPSDLPLTCAHLDTLICKNLKYLELVHCNVDLVAAFLRMAVAVKVVCLTNTPDNLSPVTSTLLLWGVTIDANFMHVATQGYNIENLGLPGCNVSDHAMRCLCKFHNLRVLDLSRSKFESVNYLSVLASSCGERLTELLLYFCWPTLSFDQLQQMLPRFKQLRSFSCYIEDYDPSSWDISSFSKLAKLQIHYSGYKIDRFFGQLTEHCRTNMQDLSLSLNLNTSISKAIHTLVSECTNLRSLKVDDYGTRKQWYTKEEKERWQNLRPGLTIGSDINHRLNVFNKYECFGT